MKNFRNLKFLFLTLIPRMYWFFTTSADTISLLILIDVRCSPRTCKKIKNHKIISSKRSKGQYFKIPSPIRRNPEDLSTRYQSG